MERELPPMVARRLDALEGAGQRRAVLAELIGLFRELVECLYTIAPPQSQPPKWSDEEVRARAEGGFPLLRPEVDVPIHVQWLHDRAGGLLELLERRSPEDKEVRSLTEAVQTERLNLDLLWPLALARDWQGLTSLARKRSLPPELIHLLAAASVQPLVEARAQQVGSSLRLDLWREPYCPACGDSPAMGEIDAEGRRHLLCASCDTSWPNPRVQCPFCGTRDHEQLHYFTAEDDPGLRVDCCRACRSYLKTLDRREGSLADDLWVVDLLTVHLDLVGQRQGYRRPAPSLVGLVLAAAGAVPVPGQWRSARVFPSQRGA